MHYENNCSPVPGNDPHDRKELSENQSLLSISRHFLFSIELFAAAVDGPMRIQRY